jgi:hypothetical protein
MFVVSMHINRQARDRDVPRERYLKLTTANRVGFPRTWTHSLLDPLALAAVTLHVTLVLRYVRGNSYNIPCVMRLGVALHSLLGHNAIVLCDYRTAPARCISRGLLAESKGDGDGSGLVDTFLELLTHRPVFFG